jgi:uncharacterized protein
MESAIYVGTLRHRRFRPVRHEFTYPLFLAFLNVDELPALMRVSGFAAYNRWNWASYYEKDHFGDPHLPLGDRVRKHAQQTGVHLSEGKIFVLTHLRYLGYNFNPVSFYYCYNQGDRLQAILAEVNNTFGETENYWLSHGIDGVGERSCKYRFPKTFHVSPFMKMQQEYEWTFTHPGDKLINHCITHQDGAPIFDSTLKMERRAWARTELHQTLCQYPWVTLKVIAGIHWEAIKLWIMRVPVVPHPGRGFFQKATTQRWGASWGDNSR